MYMSIYIYYITTINERKRRPWILETNKGYREDLEGRKENDVNITSKIKDKQREN